MGALKKIVVDIPDIRYEDHVPKSLLPATWLVTHQVFSQLRLKGRARLSSEILQDFLGAAYKNVMDQLKAAGLLKLERDYSKGLHSREYSFVPPFRTFCCKTIIDPKLVAAYERNKTNRKTKVHRWLDDILGDSALSFDEESATTEIDRLTESEFNLLHEDCSLDDYRTILRYSLHKATRLKIHYANQRLELSTVDEFGFRYHHPFTSLPKSFRRFIRWNGQGMVNVDIRNSQPLFLCLAYVETTKPMTPDWIDYKDRCEKGQLYESLNQHQIPREEFKEKFFQEILFATVNTMQSGKFAKEFQTTFPTVFGYILSLKTATPSRQLRGDDKKRPHRLAAKVLQRAESGFMFDRVIPELKERGIKPVIPIHDSILTTPENGPTVQTVIEQEFAKMGFKCGVRIEST